MTKLLCPKCFTPAYDDISFFCYKCGAQLRVNIQEKKNAGDLNFGMNVLKKESRRTRDDTRLSRKPDLIRQINPVEICARCGAPIISKNRIFCTECSAYVRDVPSGEEPYLIQYPVLKSPDKKPVIFSEIYQDTENKTIKGQEPVLIQGTGYQLFPKVSGRKIILIITAIAILFFVLIMIVILMFIFWASLY